MRLLLLSLLTLVLVGCGEIRLEIGEDDVGEVGTYTWIPEPDLNNYQNAYLVNTKTGNVQWCLKGDVDWSCAPAVSDLSLDEAIEQVRQTLN